LLLGVLYAGSGFIVLNYLNAGDLVRGLMFCYMTNTIIIIVITKYWKISIHAAGVAGPLTALWIHGVHSPFVVIFIVSILGWSRIILKAHNISQVLAGFILGSFLSGIQLLTLFQVG
jgi:membrane-associated phospholipid phosphatase